ncbi:MAG: small ribosomal subunit Rsm22 family protein, partial [Solirubrobacteraceae bacterium]
AYAAYRAPATYAAVAAALTQVRLLRPEWRPRTLLDLGAGPGVAAWAALAAGRLRTR